MISNFNTDSEIDIFVMIETWHMCSADLPLRRAAPIGFIIADAPRPGLNADGRPNHGGIAIVCRESFNLHIIAVPIYLKSFELLVCHLSSAFSNLILVVVYCPSNHTITDEFFEEFTALLEIVSIYSSTVIIWGDFNVHFDDASDTSASRFTDLLDVFNLLQHVNDATHIQGHILDLIITQPCFIPDHVNVDLPIISDHSLITCYLLLPRPTRARQRQLITRRFNTIDTKSFTGAVRCLPICVNLDLLANMSADRLCTSYQTELRHILDDIAPRITIIVTDRPSSPWFDGKCRTCRRRTCALERHYRRSCLP